MRARGIATVLSVLPLLLGTSALMAGPASAHEERPAQFPDGTGERPAFLGLDNPRHRVVCRPESAHAIDRMAAGPLKQRVK